MNTPENQPAFAALVPLPADVTTANWRQLADHERFFPAEAHGATLPVESELYVPALGCALEETSKISCSGSG